MPSLLLKFVSVPTFLKNAVERKENHAGSLYLSARLPFMRSRNRCIFQRFLRHRRQEPAQSKSVPNL